MMAQPSSAAKSPHRSAPPRTGGPERSLREMLAGPYRRLIVGAGTVVAFLLLWEAAARFGWINPTFSGTPSLIVAAGLKLAQTQPLGKDLWVSLAELGSGYGIAALVAIPIGLLFGRYPRFYALFEPMLMALYASPRAALIPVIIVWFGLGMMTKATIVFLGAVFPIMLNTISGIHSADPNLIRAARAFGATNRDILTRVLLPSALPYLAAGLRLGLGRAVTGVIVAELYINTVGVGRLIMRAQVGLNTNELMFLVFVVSGVAVLAVNLLRRLEEHLGKWRQEMN